MDVEGTLLVVDPQGRRTASDALTGPRPRSAVLAAIRVTPRPVGPLLLSAGIPSE